MLISTLFSVPAAGYFHTLYFPQYSWCPVETWKASHPNPPPGYTNRSTIICVLGQRRRLPPGQHWTQRSKFHQCLRRTLNTWSYYGKFIITSMATCGRDHVLQPSYTYCSSGSAKPRRFTQQPHSKINTKGSNSIVQDWARREKKRPDVGMIEIGQYHGTGYVTLLFLGPWLSFRTDALRHRAATEQRLYLP